MRKALAAVVAGAGLLAAACSSSSSTSSAGSSGAAQFAGTVTIANQLGATWACQFNPFNPQYNQQSFGPVYESLLFVNALQNGAVKPMLATGFTWSNNNTTLTFPIRTGVTWSDGKPFSAADVVYTFNLIKAHPALDLYSLFSAHIIKSVTASGQNVVVEFNKPASPYLYYVADQVAIVPQHVWTNVANPVTYPDATPVGTGPYVMDRCVPANIEYTANPHYWMPGEPHMAKVEYPSYIDAGPANLDLATGKAQYGGQFIPNINTFYVAKDPQNNHYWEPPVANVAMYLNQVSGPTANLDVRQALAYAIDRKAVSTVGENSQEPPANQTGIITPTFDSWMNTAAASSYGYPDATTGPNTAKAVSLLAKAGYSTSHPLSLSIITVSGYTDWDAALNEAKQELAKIGVNLTILDQAQGTYSNNLYRGDFQAAYYGDAGGPSPYYEMRQMLDSANTAAIGTNAVSNFERYRNPAVDALFDKYPTASASGQVALIQQIQHYMLSDVPTIPLTEEVNWFQYSTKNITGWPTAANPYAQPAPYSIPDFGQVLLGIKQK